MLHLTHQFSCHWWMENVVFFYFHETVVFLEIRLFKNIIKSVSFTIGFFYSLKRRWWSDLR